MEIVVFVSGFFFCLPFATFAGWLIWRELSTKTPTATKSDIDPNSPAHQALLTLVRELFFIGKVNGVWTSPNGPDIVSICDHLCNSLTDDQSRVVARLVFELKSSSDYHSALVATKRPPSDRMRPSEN